MKHIYLENGVVKVKGDEESLRCAMDIALGKDYTEYEIDPVEAFALVSHLQDGATHLGNKRLLSICIDTLDKLRPLAQVYLIAEHGLHEDEEVDWRNAIL